MKLVVGLGNPGPEYEQTRHNAGFLVVDYLAHDEGASFYPTRFQALLARINMGSSSIHLVKPQTYMNLSGLAVASLVRFYKVDPKSDLLVISDDLDLPLGRLRLRMRGGHGGQRGLLSVIQGLGTDEFCRLRLGIDRPTDGRAAKNHVMSTFQAPEEQVLDKVILAAAAAVRIWIKDGPLEAMNRFNNFDAHE